MYHFPYISGANSRKNYRRWHKNGVATEINGISGKTSPSPLLSARAGGRATETLLFPIGTAPSSHRHRTESRPAGTNLYLQSRLGGGAAAQTVSERAREQVWAAAPTLSLTPPNISRWSKSHRFSVLVGLYPYKKSSGFLSSQKCP